MGGSIAHPDPLVSLRTFLAVLALALDGAAARASETGAAATVRDFAALARAIEPRPSGLVEPATRLPVCRFLEPALEVAAGPLAGVLGALVPTLSWTQNPNYRRRPPDATFLDHYGYAVIAGPAAGPRALVDEPRLALGVLLLGPHTHYPRHAHPAVEVYYTLTPAEWWREGQPWRVQGPETAIHHAPNVPHATRSGSTPLLAIYLWRGDLDTHARLTGTGA